MIRLGGFWKRGSADSGRDPEVSARIKGWARAALGLGDDATISVNEIVCADPDCPGSETVILVMKPGQRTKAYKVLATMADATEAMVQAALTG